jgi:hypothetical protein
MIFGVEKGSSIPGRIARGNSVAMATTALRSHLEILWVLSFPFRFFPLLGVFLEIPHCGNYNPLFLNTNTRRRIVKIFSLEDPIRQ